MLVPFCSVAGDLTKNYVRKSPLQNRNTPTTRNLPNEQQRSSFCFLAHTASALSPTQFIAINNNNDIDDDIAAQT